MSDKPHPIVTLLNPFCCPFCKGPLTHFSSTTYLTGQFIDPESGLVMEKIDDEMNEDYLQCISCSRSFDNYTIIDEQCRIRHTIDRFSAEKIVEPLRIKPNPVKMIKGKNNPFYKNEG